MASEIEKEKVMKKSALIIGQFIKQENVSNPVVPTVLGMAALIFAPTDDRLVSFG